MTPNKQVSPAIRILRGERDASARATHLEAATRKFLVTTNERKQMSTKTNFKRIALVAVAALGLGVLSSVPSQATSAGVTVTITDGKSTTTGFASDSTTAGNINIAGYLEALDSVTIQLTPKGTPPTGGAKVWVMNLDSATATQTGTVIETLTSSSTNATVAAAGAVLAVGSNTTAAQDGAEFVRLARSSASANVNWNFGVQLDSATGTRASGTYTYTVVVKSFDAGNATRPVSTISKDINIVVAALATASTTASAVTSTAILSSVVSNVWQASATDSIIAAPGTASSTSAAAVKVALLNADSGTAPKDSLTITIDKGNVSISTTTTCGTSPTGKNLIYAYSAATVYVCIAPDGSTGTGTLTIATKNAGTFTKSVAWYGTDVKSIVAAQRLTNIGATETAGTGNAIRAQAFDANTINLAAGTALYSYSSDTTIVSNYGTACGATAYSATDAQWFTYCPLTVVSGKSGSVTITIRDAATVATSTVASNGVSVRVSTGTASSITLTTDKASYAPGEKGYLIVTVKDAAGLVMPARSSTATLAAGGITTTGQLGNSSDTLTATDFATARSSTPSSTDPIKVYTFYAPASAGTVTFSAKGASTFSAASQTTAATVTITVADSASAALAAVSALAVTVASLKTLITTLTNLVLKIQKKVKA